jgi:hypothetical protein
MPATAGRARELTFYNAKLNQDRGQTAPGLRGYWVFHEWQPEPNAYTICQDNLVEPLPRALYTLGIAEATGAYETQRGSSVQSSLRCRVLS